MTLPVIKPRVILGAIGALGCWLGFPNPLLHLPLLSLIFPAVLAVAAVQAASARRAFRFGFCSGLVGYSACLYWVAVPVHDFGYLPWIVALPFPLLLGAYIALYSGGFSLAVYQYSSGFIARPNAAFSFQRLQTFDLLKLGLFTGVVWALLEYLRGWLLTGFPWLTLSSAFVPWVWAIQGLSALGAYALSGLYAGIAVSAGLCIALLCERKNGTPLRPAGPALGFALLALLALSAWSIAAFSPKPISSQAIGVVLVQGNVNQDQKWNPAYQEATLNHYAALSTSALRQTAAPRNSGQPPTAPPPYIPPMTLVVWPETAMPFFYSRSGALGTEIQDFARREAVHLLFGAPDMRKTPDRTEIHNRAYLLDPGGRTLGFYDKEHLVPFGEYAPAWLRLPALEFLLDQVGDLDPGTQTAPLRIPTPAGETRLGMLICYEVIFPELARKRVADGSNIFLTISNDAWFGKTAAAEQHLQLATMRAVEQGKWLVRGTNTGISAIINRHGEREAESGLFCTETLSGLAYTQDGATLFYHLEPYLPYSLIFMLALLLGLGYTGRRRG